MPLATLDDINVHLPEDKIQVLESVDDSVQLDAERMVKGYLAGIYSPSTLAGWSDPEETDQAEDGYVPETIKAIAGRFIAAFVYRRAFSEDIVDDPEFAQVKYNEAMSMLMDLKSGVLVLADVEEVVDTAGRLTRADFWPNDDAPGPFFTVEMEH